MEEIKVSVVIPVYNTESYLDETLRSVVSQSLKEIEVICVNDGSSDNSLAILRGFESKDRRVKVVDIANGGAGRARNIGLKECRGEYVIFFDSDDYMATNALQLLYDNARESGSDITIGASRLLDEESGKFSAIKYSIKRHLLNNERFVKPQEHSRYIIQAFVGWPWDKLYRREFIEEKGLEYQNLRHSNDTYFVLLSIVESSLISYIDDVVFTHRQHRASLANTRVKSPACFYEALVALHASLVECGEYDRYEQSFTNYCIEFSRWHIETIGDEAARVVMVEFFYRLDKKFELRGHRSDYYDHESYISWMYSVTTQYILSLRSAPQAVDTALEGVSVIIPIYNVEPYLELCIRSIINQTYRGAIQIICVNDGSTDGSLALLKKLALEDRRIVVIDQENAGLGPARNSGLKVAIHEWVMFCDSDDFYELDTIENMSMGFESEPDLIEGGFMVFGDACVDRLSAVYNYCNFIHDHYSGLYTELDDMIKQKMRISVCGKLFRRSIIERCRIYFPSYHFEDMAFWCVYLFVCKRIHILDHYCPLKTGQLKN